MSRGRKKVALALGGGAARGFAHIGVLKIVEEAQIPVDLVVGTSMGGLVGALYCSGMSLRMMERIANHTKRNLWMDLTFPVMGLVSGEKLEQFVYLLTRRANFNELKTPLAVVATDLANGEKVVIREGPVARAVRATSAIPGIFCPVEYQGKMLVDGSVVERVPVPTAKELGADVVIAVDVGTYMGNSKVNHMFDVVTQCLDIMTRDICHYQTKRADLVIYPPLQNIAPGHFHRALEAIQIGEMAAAAMLPQMKEILYKEGCYEPDAANS